ncbi:MAG TPA: hypothetical protein DGT21_25835 [Armatimonadetes bacterium]|jgi:hypothetical protein|nr:hypothetical protein [Armatimonadota bacterium]
MHLEVLVEDESTEKALERVIPRILPACPRPAIHPFQGKHDLLRKLPARLRAYARWLPADSRIVVLIDEDRQNCHQLKAQLEQAARQAGLTTRSSAGEGQQFQVLTRIAIEELEAWFFGDIAALRAAYPRVPAALDRNQPYRDPDAIAGGTWEALQRVLQRAHYFPGGIPKIEVAREISRHMDPAVNRSHSFQVFRQGLLELAALGATDTT